MSVSESKRIRVDPKISSTEILEQKDLLGLIIEYLKFFDVIKLILTSKFMHKTIRNDEKFQLIWKRIFDRFIQKQWLIKFPFKIHFHYYALHQLYFTYHVKTLWDIIISNPIDRIFFLNKLVKITKVPVEQLNIKESYEFTNWNPSDNFVIYANNKIGRNHLLFQMWMHIISKTNIKYYISKSNGIQLLNDELNNFLVYFQQVMSKSKQVQEQLKVKDGRQKCILWHDIEFFIGSIIASDNTNIEMEYQKQILQFIFMKIKPQMYTYLTFGWTFRWQSKNEKHIEKFTQRINILKDKFIPLNVTIDENTVSQSNWIQEIDKKYPNTVLLKQISNFVKKLYNLN